MTLTDNFDDLINHYARRANDIVQRHDDDIRALFADSGLLDVAPPELVEMNALRAEAAQFDRDVAQTSVLAGQVLPPDQRLGWKAALNECDALLTDAFTHGTRHLSNRSVAPLNIIASTDKWLKAVGEGLKLSYAEIETWRDRQRVLATSKLALHVPGTGTFVNAEAVEQTTRHATDQRQQYSIALRELTAERWGRRLITDDTAVGRELAQSGAWLRQLRREWQIDTMTGPDSAEAVLAVSTLTRAGWPCWVVKYALGYARVEDAMATPARFGGEGLAEFLDSAGEAFNDTLQAVLDQPAQIVKAWFTFIVKTLLIAKGVRPSIGLLALRAARQLGPGLDALFDTVSVRRFSDRLAEKMFTRLEAAIGPDNIPYAVQMACGVSYDIARFDFKQLSQRIATNAELDIDLRLIQLGDLKDMRLRSVRDVARAARNDLNMIVPPEMFDIS